MEPDRGSDGQWRQRWHAALVGPAARGVRARAKGASGGDPVAQGQFGWSSAGQLRGRWRYQHLGVGEWRTPADTATRPALRAAQYQRGAGIDGCAAGHAASVGSGRGRHISWLREELWLSLLPVGYGLQEA